MVRQGRVELPRYFYRQPLKLVRLPIPPLPHYEVQSRDTNRPVRCQRIFVGVRILTIPASILYDVPPWQL